MIMSTRLLTIFASLTVLVSVSVKCNIMQDIQNIIKSMPKQTHFMTIINEYISRKVETEDVNNIVSEIMKINEELQQPADENNAQFKRLQKNLSVLIKLINLAKQGRICSPSAQIAFGNVEVHLISHITDLKLKGISNNYSRIKLIVDYYRSERRQICGEYYAKYLLELVDLLNAMKLSQLQTVLTPLMDEIILPRGGYSARTCASNWLDFPFNRPVAANLILAGLKASEAKEDLDRLVVTTRDTAKGEQDFLHEFAQLLDRHLIRPCTSLHKNEDIVNEIKLIRLYTSMYGEDIELFSTGAAQDDERLFRFMALFKTCSVVTDKVAALSIALLNELGFRLGESQLSNKQISSILSERY